MLRSLFSGISGLRVNQTMLDVTGNNIANANTVGFKSSTTVFSSTLSQMLTAASAPANPANTATGVGGTNPIQIGLGVQVGAVATNFTQGSNQTTGVNTNLMINGDGFFVLGSGGSGDLGDVANPANTYLTRAGAFNFDSAGNLVAPDGKYVQGYLAGTTGTGIGDDRTGLGKINLNTAAAIVNPGANLQAYEIGSDGTITGTFDDGTKLALATLAVANVSNPQGLNKASNTQFTQSSNSGQLFYATANATTTVGQNGSLTAGALEMSNVDLAQEFTNLIIAQRGFEASSKVITTSDQVLSDLVNMIR